MIWSDADIDGMLEAVGQAAIIDDGSINGLTLWCNFLDPQQIVNQFDMSVEMSLPSAKVRSSAVADFIARGLLFTTGGKDYTIKTFEIKTSGYATLQLKDA